MLTIKNTALHLAERFSLRDIQISINKGEHVAVIGESGCGKTSFLKLIYGLYDADQGTLQWGDTPITGPKDNLVPGMPFIKYLSQDFDLMPFITVTENIQKYLSRLYPKQSAARTAELLEVVEMTPYADVHVKTLSGGQKQRVALAQTLAKEPELLLLDEPFSHIDNFRKNNLRRRLFRYLKEQEITCLVATHDSTDILSFTDRTLVMREGRIIADKHTETLYNHPTDHYVASLFGEVNTLPKGWFFNEDASDSFLCYPHQVCADDTGVEVIVKASYFYGGHWLIEAQKEEISLFFEHKNAVKGGTRMRVGLKDS